MVTEGDVVYVAVAPKEPLDPGVVEKVSATIDKDIFRTRVLLKGPIPRIVGRYSTSQEADSIAEKLRSLGLVAVVCAGSELRRVSKERFRAHAIDLKDGGVTFWDRGGRERRVVGAEALLMLRGALQTQVQKETVKTRTELNLAATVITGGIPITRKVVERTRSESHRSEEFVRLYGWTSSEPMVEILQNDFDYVSLGDKKGFSTLENINILTAELRRSFPAAAFDGRLAKHYTVDVPFPTPQDEIEINSKLIYLCHRAVSGAGPAE